MYLKSLQLHQILLLFINSIMIIIASTILMKIFFQFNPWPWGKFSTRARVKVVFTPSILDRLLNSLFHLRSAIMFLGFLFSLSLFGTWDLVILMIKPSKVCFLMSNLYWIKIILLISLVLIAYLVKCTIYLFPILNLQPLHLLNLLILTCGVLHLLILLMSSNITFCLLIITLDLLGFICWGPN